MKPLKREKETLEAKLRNALSPIYGLADMIILDDGKNPDLTKIIKATAKQAIKNKKKIQSILTRMEERNQK